MFQFSATYDYAHPMSGIFHEMRKQNFPIKNLLTFINSTRFSNQEWLPVDILIDELDHNIGWATENFPNSYFEIRFLNITLDIKGYSLSVPSGDDEMIRNWKLTCFYGTKETQIDFHENDESLCPNREPFSICGYNAQVYFKLNNIYRCDALRLTQTGPNNSQRDFLNLLGFEVFGRLFSGNGQFKVPSIGKCVSFRYDLIYVIILI